MMDNSNYNFEKGLRLLSDTELVDRFNREVGGLGWTHARGAYLEALRQEFFNRRIDCSAVADQSGMSLRHQVTLVDKRLIIVSP